MLIGRIRWQAVLAVALAAVTVALLALAWTLAYVNGDFNPVNSVFGPDLVVQTGILPVGLIIALRRRENPLGWLFLSASVLGALHAASGEYTIHGLLTAGGTPGLIWAAWLQNWIIDPVFPAGAFLFVVLLFPDGRLPGPRWRSVAWAAIATTTAVGLLAILSDWPIAVAPNVRALANPTGIKGFSSSFFGNLWWLWIGSLALLFASGAGMVVRYRRSSGEQRQQIKWFAYAVAATLVAYAPTVVFSSSSSFSSWTSNLVIEVGVGVAMPVACGIAILKYRLYGIDVVISRTLVYGALAALITGVYIGIAVGIGSLAGAGGKPNLGLSILATAIVAVGFQPVRTRLQRIANRLVYGPRATPYEVLSQFSSRVAETYAADDVLPRMARVLRDGTSAAAASVWLRSGNHLRPAATAPEEVMLREPIALNGAGLPSIEGADRAVAVLHQGELLGALTVTKRRGDPLTPTEEKLLGDLAHQAGLVLKNVGLTGELLQRLEELRASRRRLVAAQDEERRRLERNLHDGAQQHLVALKVKIGLAETFLQKDTAKAESTLRQLKQDADEALETLRDLARGIYPPVLADQGLTSALQAQARKASIPVAVEASNVRRYPQAEESAVYFCVLEALQNAQKYSGAAGATVRIEETEATLRFEVADDGRGFDTHSVRRGAGLTNMADRLDALGGAVEVVSSPGHGCRVIGSLPVPELNGDRSAATLRAHGLEARADHLARV